MDNAAVDGILIQENDNLTLLGEVSVRTPTGSPVLRDLWTTVYCGLQHRDWFLFYYLCTAPDSNLRPLALKPNPRPTLYETLYLLSLNKNQNGTMTKYIVKNLFGNQTPRPQPG